MILWLIRIVISHFLNMKSKEDLELKNYLNNYIEFGGVSDAENVELKNYDHAIYDLEGFNSYLHRRDGQFQVQIFQFESNKSEMYVIPEHTHPNVNSYEIYLTGTIFFSHSGKWVYPKHPSLRYYKRKNKKRLRCIQVNNNDVHGAVVKPEVGGKFISVQHWLNGVKPSCVGMDYKGYGVSKKQSEVNGVLYDDDCPRNENDILQRDWRMAASLETRSPFS